MVSKLALCIQSCLLPVLIAVCPNASDILPPTCALLYDNSKCDGQSLIIIENTQQMELDSQWNDRAAKAVVRPDCYLDLCDGVNLTLPHRYLGGHVSRGNVYELSWLAFENRTSSLECQCYTPPY